MRVPRWFEKGNCHGRSELTRLFYSFSYVDQRKAKSYCIDCPIQQRCLEWALDNQELGVWGGKTEDERKDYRFLTLLSAKREAVSQHRTTHEQSHPVRASLSFHVYIEGQQNHTRQVLSQVLVFEGLFSSSQRAS